MKKLAIILLVAMAIIMPALVDQSDRQAPVKTEQNTRFAPLHVYIDSGDQALAVYQFELKVIAGQAKIVGVEGGQAKAFQQPPYYDPGALARDRIIIAAFDIGTDLPQGRTRVATIHLQIIGDAQPEYQAELTVAASASGKEISAEITLEQGEQK